MVTRTFEGFGELPLAASEYGSRHDPCVVLLPDQGSMREDWVATAEALADAGRHVITLDLRGHGGSATENDDRRDVAALVGDLNAVLRQLSSRPVILGAGLGALIAMIVLGEGEPDLASGLIVAAHAPTQTSGSGTRDSEEVPEMPEFRHRAELAAPHIRLPSLALLDTPQAALTQIAQSVPELEFSELAGSVDLQEDFNAALITFLERRMPRTAPEYVAGSDPRTLRDALGTFATGVTVVTTKGPGGVPIGLTANSFTSVSLDPPLLLVCPARDATSTSVLSKAEHFAVNVLHIGQQDTSTLFATRGEDRFASTECEYWEHDVPIIRNSLASFECRKYAEYEGGDHAILLGEVLRVRYAPQRDPLLYFRGKYRRLHFG